MWQSYDVVTQIITRKDILDEKQIILLIYIYSVLFMPFLAQFFSLQISLFKYLGYQKNRNVNTFVIEY